MADGTITYRVEVDNTGAVSSLRQVESTATESSERGASAFSRLGTAMQIEVIEAAEKAAQAILNIGIQAVEAYAQFEQLSGGAELVFGDAFQTVSKNAENAYKTVQMSANDYLTQVNKFAVGLKESLNGDADAAANLADRIVVAEADIVAAMGISAESVQYAFAGVMRGNYMMLDNLQLGIKGSKEGMQEVIDKVNEWNAAQGNATNYQMGNYADMESALIDYVEMCGFAGYASMEASETIEGSMASLKAAWQNTLVALAAGGDELNEKIPQLVDAAGKAFANIIPIIGNILSSLLDNLGEWLGGVVERILANMPEILAAAAKLFLQILAGLIKALPSILEGVYNGLAQLVAKVTDKEFLVGMLKAGIALVQGLWDGIAQKIKDLIAAIPRLFGSIVDGVKNFFGIASPSKLFKVEIGYNIGAGIAEGIEGSIPSIKEAMNQANAAIVATATSILPSTSNTSNTTIVNVGSISSSNDSVVAAATNLVSALQMDMRMGVVNG